MGHGYAFSLSSRLGADFPEKRFNFYNRGISGNKVNDLAGRWKTDTLDLKPDVLSILVGINDSASVVFKREPVIPVEKYEEIYRSLLEQTKAQFPKIIFVLCESFILPVGSVKENLTAYTADLGKRQAIVRQLAVEFNAVFVGLQDVFNKACTKAPSEYWMWDGIHPTVAGHELVAREWLKQVEKRIIFK
jgi:lysophospholipase L1-like esterase